MASQFAFQYQWNLTNRLNFSNLSSRECQQAVEQLFTPSRVRMYFRAAALHLNSPLILFASWIILSEAISPDTTKPKMRIRGLSGTPSNWRNEPTLVGNLNSFFPFFNWTCPVTIFHNNSWTYKMKKEKVSYRFWTGAKAPRMRASWRGLVAKPTRRTRSSNISSSGLSTVLQPWTGSLQDAWAISPGDRGRPVRQ